MSYVKSWILGMTAAALAVALAQALTPEGAVKRAGKLAGGLVLLLAALRPLLQWDFPDLAGAAWAGTVSEEEALEAGEKTLKRLIAEKTAAYIEEKGSRLGCQVTVSVSVQKDKSGWPVPWTAEVAGCWTEAQEKDLRAYIARELDIPTERQTFRMCRETGRVERKEP